MSLGNVTTLQAGLSTIKWTGIDRRARPAADSEAQGRGRAWSSGLYSVDKLALVATLWRQKLPTVHHRACLARL